MTTQSYLTNEEVLDAFRDWQSKFKGGTINGRPMNTDEDIEARTAVIRDQFAEFIEPKHLEKSTIADLKAFSRHQCFVKKPLVARRVTLHAMIHFEGFLRDLKRNRKLSQPRGKVTP